MTSNNSTPALHIGWAQADITPQELPVYIAGQFYARISEGIHDPLTATALALESGGSHVVFVSVDTVGISDALRDAVHERLDFDGLDGAQVILHATHTHAAALNRVKPAGSFQLSDDWEKEFALNVVPTENYVRFAGERIAAAIGQAWQARTPGGIAFGQDYAVVGRNRRWMDTDGNAIMYGLDEKSAARFDHIEGYEDHSLNLLTTYDAHGVLTGLLVNLPSPSQESEHSFEVSADFWHETRQELRARYGDKLFILPQCSAAGDQTSHLIFEKEPHERMLKLRGHSQRREIALRIADAVDRVLPYLPPTIDYAPRLEHRHETLQLPVNHLNEMQVEDARLTAEKLEEKYEAEKKRLRDNPELRKEARWYVPLTRAYNSASWHRSVIDRYEKSKSEPHYPAEVHTLRLGEIAFATNPFEYYLDFGIQIKVQSPATQTFVVQLAGPGNYVPSFRGAKAGGYGAIPACNLVGPEGGDIMARHFEKQIGELWKV